MTIDPKIQGAQPERREKNRQRGTADVLVPFMSLTSAGMLGFAVPNLISGSGATFYGKCILITAGAAIVSWGVNTLAIKRGAPLFSKGYLIAGLTSVSTVALVGAGLWSATYSGLVASDVEQMHLDSHAQQMGDHVARERTRTQKLFEVGVVVIAIRDGFAQKFACEVASACVSGRGSGEGPTSREIANQLPHYRQRSMRRPLPLRTSMQRWRMRLPTTKRLLIPTTRTLYSAVPHCSAQGWNWTRR